MSLLDNLKAFWKLGEVSGTRVDSVGSNDLADINTVTQNPGKIGNAAQFTHANSESLDGGDVAALSLGDVDFTVSGWIYFDTKSSPTPLGILSKWGIGSGRKEYKLMYNSGNDRLEFRVSSDGASEISVTANNFGSPGTGVFIFVVAWHDAVANTINIQVNNGGVDSVSHSSGVSQGLAGFRLGSLEDASNGTRDYWNGRIDAAGFWDKILTVSEKTELYNDGNGLEYPFTIINVNSITANWSVVDPIIATEAVTLTPDSVVVNWSVVTPNVSSINLDRDLIAFWKLKEASGTRIDSVGSNDLADNATVTQADGIVGKAAQFVKVNSEFLSIVDNLALSTGDIDFTVLAWVYLDSKPGTSMDIFTKYLPSGNQREYALWWDTGADRFKFYADPDGTAGSFNIVTANNFGDVPTGEWILVAMWHDKVANTINIQINNGTIDSTNHSTGVFDGTAPVRIGARGDGVEYWDGRIDAIGFWKKVLNEGEKTKLYNDGNGQEYPFGITTPDSVSVTWSVVTPTVSSINLDRDLIAFWKLKEASGATRVDSVGSNDLADNNTVTQIGGKVGSGAHFTRTSSQFLSIVDNVDNSIGDIDFAWAGWVYLDSKANDMAVLGKWNAGDQREYLLIYLSGADRFHFTVSPDGTTTATTINADAFGNVPTGEWIFVVIWHDAIANTINIQVNNGGINSSAHTTGVFDGTGPFNIGAHDFGSLSFFDGRIDAIGFWKKVLNEGEKTKLYNDGNGQEYPFGITTPDSVSVTWSVVTPTVEISTGQTITPDIVSITWSVVTPAVINPFSQIVTADVIVTTWSAPIITTSLGNTLVTDPVVITWTVITSVTVVGTVTLTPNALVADWSVVTPVVNSVFTSIPDALVVNWSTVIPNIFNGNILTISIVVANWSTVTPVTIVGAVTLTLNALVANWLVANPTVTNSLGQIVTSDVIVVNWSVVTPDIFNGSILVLNALVITHVVVEPYIVESPFTRIRPKIARQRIRPIIPNERRRPRS